MYLQKGITLNKWFTMLPIHILAANPEQVSIELLCITVEAEKTASEEKKMLLFGHEYKERVKVLF